MLAAGAALLAGAAALAASDGTPFSAFESGRVRPLALSPEGTHVYAVNTPDNRLEIFQILEHRLIARSAVPVGLEPVSVAVRGDAIWVVNKLSDSVSVIMPGPAGRRVVRTLSTGDEPQDIVFAGTGRGLAFVTVARRGLERPLDPLGGNGSVWVFDATDPANGSADTALAVLEMFSDVPRALAATADGQTVYAAAFNSGNRTTVVPDQLVNGNLPPPLTNAEGEPAPATGLIVRYDGARWLDAGARDWSPVIPYSVTDFDVFTIDASLPVPVVSGSFEGVGTTLFNMAVNPVNGDLYVSNTEARNHVRFEGPGVFGNSTVRGHIAESRITIIDPAAGIVPRHLNKHIDYSSFPGTTAEKAASLAFPLGMAVSGDGKDLYVAALGSGEVGVFDTRALKADTFVPSPARHIAVTGGGPTAVLLDEPRNQLYVQTLFDNGISVVDLDTRQEVSHVVMHNPEPRSIVDGRRFLYDARFSSSRGTSACASCHVFGDKDELAWDLGNPDGLMQPNPNPRLTVPGGPPPEPLPDFHPMKGPMTTQSFRGMANHGPMHWRGDRTGGAEPGGDPMDEEAAFMAFKPAFEDLLGRAEPVTDEEMAAFTDFALQLVYPPNPNRRLDDTLTPPQQRGSDFFFIFPTAAPARCESCHVTDPDAGFFGTRGESADTLGPQILKIAHLRNLYTKAGTGIGALGTAAATTRFKGFAFSHDGSTPTLSTFIKSLNEAGFVFPLGAAQRNDVEAFLMVFPTGLAPAVGHQVTLTETADAGTLARLGTLLEQALANGESPKIDLVAHGRLDGAMRGWLLVGRDAFVSDRRAEPAYGFEDLLQVVQLDGQEITFTGVPSGSGLRTGLDRDADGVFDRDELDAGTDPADPADVPDTDGDGVDDGVDNCLATDNPDQRDSNADGFGNLCDADLNDDCIVGFADLAIMKSVFFGNDPDADLDGDGAVGFGDLGLMKSAFFTEPGPSAQPNACDAFGNRQHQ